MSLIHIKSQTEGHVALLDRIVFKEGVEIVFRVQSNISPTQIGAQTINKVIRIIISFKLLFHIIHAIVELQFLATGQTETSISSNSHFYLFVRTVSEIILFFNLGGRA